MRRARITFGPRYRITACATDPRLVGEVVTLEHVLPDRGEVRLDPDYIGEHWYFTAADGVEVVPC